MTGNFNNAHIFLIFNSFYFILVIGMVKCAPTPFYSLQRYTEYVPVSSDIIPAPLSRNDKQYSNTKRSLSNNRQLEQKESAYKIICFQPSDNLDVDANYQLRQIFLCKHLYSSENGPNNNNNFGNKIYDPLLPDFNNAIQEQLSNPQKSIINPVFSEEPELFKNLVVNTNYLRQLVKPNNLQAYKNSEKVKRNYDFIRFGRSDSQIKKLTDPFAQQQKKQDDKKATGNTYDYIRFGKRSANFL